MDAPRKRHGGTIDPPRRTYHGITTEAPCRYHGSTMGPPGTQATSIEAPWTHLGANTPPWRYDRDTMKAL